MFTILSIVKNTTSMKQYLLQKKFKMHELFFDLKCLILQMKYLSSIKLYLFCFAYEVSTFNNIEYLGHEISYKVVLQVVRSSAPHAIGS